MPSAFLLSRASQEKKSARHGRNKRAYEVFFSVSPQSHSSISRSLKTFCSKTRRFHWPTKKNAILPSTSERENLIKMPKIVLNKAYVKIFAIGVFYSVIITRQLFVQRNLQLMNATGAWTFLHSQQTVFSMSSSFVQYDCTLDQRESSSVTQNVSVKENNVQLTPDKKASRYREFELTRVKI